MDNTSALSMDSLLADMNHEIRSSMNGITGMLELLCDAGLSDAQLEYARKARSSAHTLQALIERLSELSLIAACRVRLVSGPFDLLREARAAFAGKQDAAQTKGLRFSATLPSQLPALDGDAARIQGLLSCLADTMIRFAGHGEISAVLTAACGEAGMYRVQADIKAAALAEPDKHLLATLRQPRAPDAATLRMHGRKALEPVLCAALAQLLGAHIDVTTDEHDVTTLCCRLALPMAASSPSSLRGILIAERAAEWRALLSPFTVQGISIDPMNSAMDGLLALKRAAGEGNPYRVVMLGSRVQGMDATILSAAIKGDAAVRGATLVLLSERDSEDETALAQAGFAAVIGRSAAQDSVRRALEQIRKAAASGAGQEPVSAAHAISTPPAIARTAIPSGKRRILVADDNPVNREVAVRMLEKLGFECAHAADGREAVDLHRSQAFDMILMDCEMPRMDGFEATAVIRSQEPASAHTPVIALTASTSQDEREKCLASGMDDFLSKPIRPQVLSEVLARWTPAEAPAMPSLQPSACKPLSDELDAVRAMFGADFAELAQLYQRDTPPRMRRCTALLLNATARW